MSDNPVEQVISDLFRYLEVLETQSGAMLQLLKDKKIVSDKKLAAYLEQAATVSEVKWRAARTRMEHLFAAMPEPAKTDESTKKEVPQKEQPQPEAQQDRQVKAQPQPDKNEKEKEAMSAADSRPKDGVADRPNSEQPTPKAAPTQPKAASDSKPTDVPSKSPEAPVSTKTGEAASTTKAAEAKESGEDKDGERSDQHWPANKDVAEVQSGKISPPQPKPAPHTEKEVA